MSGNFLSCSEGVNDALEVPDVRCACNAGDLSSVPGWGRSPGEGNGYPFQYSYLENLTDRGAWRATVHGVAKSQTQLGNEQLYFSKPKGWMKAGRK